jgi:predicted membrane-bound spermidine synthase
MELLTEWNSFYVIVGSSAGALIGLQFVIIALIAEMPRARASAQTTSAFSTPSVVHFVVVLFLSAVLSAPWHGIGKVAVVCGLVGLAGIVYAIVVARRLRRQTAYQPVFEDWLFHVLLPLAAYAVLAAAAFVAGAYARRALFVVAAATLLLLFVGIHNAWDAVTYLVFVHRNKSSEDEDDEQSEQEGEQQAQNNDEA